MGDRVTNHLALLLSSQLPKLVQSHRNSIKVGLVSGAERHGNIFTCSIPIEDRIARLSYCNELGCNGSIVNWCEDVGSKLTWVIDCACIRQEQDFGDVAQLRAHVEQFSTPIAPNAMMLSFKV